MDTDHVNALQSEESAESALIVKMGRSSDRDFTTTAITLKEQLRGWLALIHRLKDVHQQIPAYQHLVALSNFLGRWKILPFDEPAADRFTKLREQKIRLGTMDLKIAAIAVVNDALLLTANVRDFERVAGLRIENWLRDDEH